MAPDCVDLVDKNDAVLRTLHIIVRSRKQLADYALNVVAYVACLRE